MREVQQTGINKWGDETHPAFGVIGASRVSTSPPGAVLFDGDVLHQHTVRIRIKPASRKRDLNHDWIHGGGLDYIEVELSEAQWASFVSSMNNGDGVPCSVRYLRGEEIPGFPYDPRLAHSISETREAADKAFEEIKGAMAAYDALDPKAPAKEKKEALSRLRAAINHTASTITFAAKSLNEHAENVVQQARADVEAFVVNKARQLGIEAGELGETPILPEGHRGE